MYWNNSKIIGYNALFNFVVGARGCGKTWSSKFMLFKHYLRKGHKFLYMMRYDTELEQATSSGRFFADLAEKFPDYEFKREGDEGLIRRINLTGEKENDNPWEQICYFKALSSSAIKALSDPAIKWIVFDEFLPNPGVRYLKNEVEKFLEFYFTISRGTRNVRVLFLGNNTRSVNPYFEYFKIPTIRQGEIWCYNDKAVENVKNEEFAQVMKNTRFGKLIAGSDYEAYAVDNKTLADESTFVEKLPKGVKPICTIVSKYGVISIGNKSNMCFVIDNDSGLYKFAADLESHNEETELLKRNTFICSYVRGKHQYGLIRYTSARAKSIFEQALDSFIKGG